MAMMTSKQRMAGMGIDIDTPRWQSPAVFRAGQASAPETQCSKELSAFLNVPEVPGEVTDAELNWLGRPEGRSCG
ncbi:uncharacterized protein N7482_005364 [Penicillium canariense]|uniref:Uncharacterized protein n=1 Tax=Penicillium canariense TaxID=189055 RepID=A0A9W9LND2_9EURO|nr:uncharacterized protein N7482_005364 [Penicillium canariense]KAJ5166583.1 hypothetical protein N7482_005364 [Penicillium canariense]